MRRCLVSGAKVTAHFEMQLRGWENNVLYKNRGFT
jgi:hypothetical protein